MRAVVGIAWIAAKPRAAARFIPFYMAGLYLSTSPHLPEILFVSYSPCLFSCVLVLLLSAAEISSPRNPFRASSQGMTGSLML